MSVVRLSVIIPCRNAASTVAAAIESVLKQSVASIELIVVEGASDDDSLQRINIYKDKISHLISGRDSGVYAAINKGLQVASGEWIYILGADDRLAAADVCEKALACASDETMLLLGAVRNFSRESAKIPLLHTNDWSSGILWKNTVHQQSVFYRKKVFSNFRFREDLRVLSDYDLHLKLWKEKVAVAHTGLIIAECEAQGLSKNFGFSLYREELRMKYARLGLFLFILNIPWVIAKFLYKNLK